MKKLALSVSVLTAFAVCRADNFVQHTSKSSDGEYENSITLYFSDSTSCTYNLYKENDSYDTTFKCMTLTHMDWLVTTSSFTDKGYQRDLTNHKGLVQTIIDSGHKGAIKSYEEDESNYRTYIYLYDPHQHNNTSCWVTSITGN